MLQRALEYAESHQGEIYRCMSVIPCKLGCGLKYTVPLEKYLKSWHDNDRLLAVG
jgi:hypothetical protein